MKSNCQYVKELVWLHILLLFFSFMGIFSKLAAREEIFSVKFLLYYGIVLLNLFIYAICWQQIIKKMPLIVAYMNKAVTVVWGLVFGRIVFDEKITFSKLLGASIIICGILLVVTDKEEKSD